MRQALLRTDGYNSFHADVNASLGTRPSPLSGLIDKVFGGVESSSHEAVLFTSSESRAGVNWMVSTVATELAAAGRKVLLADAEVVASLSNSDSVVSLCDHIGSGRIWVLGKDQAASAKFPLRSGRGQQASVLFALLEEFPHIVLDAPAMAISDVALRLAPLVSGSIFVVREGKTEKQGLVQACGLLETLCGRLLGCVYNAHWQGEKRYPDDCCKNHPRHTSPATQRKPLSHCGSVASLLSGADANRALPRISPPPERCTGSKVPLHAGVQPACHHQSRWTYHARSHRYLHRRRSHNRRVQSTRKGSRHGTAR